MTRVVGLTGNIASGKSSVARLLAEWGAVVIDADAIVHSLQQPGQPVYQAIIERFGPGIIAGNGELDRAALRAAMLADPDNKQDLERLVHPAVYQRIRERITQAGENGAALVVADIPLLFETGDPAEFDAVILVDAPVAERRRRLIEDRGIDPGQADALIAAQLPADLKRRAADVVIDNDADLETLARRTRDAWATVISG